MSKRGVGSDGQDKVLGDVLDRVEALEERLAELEKRPLAGRPPERLVQVTAWLTEFLRGGRVKPSSDVIRTGVKAGYSEALIRKASLRLNVTKEAGKWSLSA